MDRARARGGRASRSDGRRATRRPRSLSARASSIGLCPATLKATGELRRAEADPARVGAVGYCMGGPMAWFAAATAGVGTAEIARSEPLAATAPGALVLDQQIS